MLSLFFSFSHTHIHILNIHPLGLKPWKSAGWNSQCNDQRRYQSEKNEQIGEKLPEHQPPSCIYYTNVPRCLEGSSEQNECFILMKVHSVVPPPTVQFLTGKTWFLFSKLVSDTKHQYSLVHSSYCYHTYEDVLSKWDITTI